MHALLVLPLVFLAGASVCAQDAATPDRNAVNNPSAPPVPTGMMADSPVVFPAKGALPPLFPPDVAVERNVPEPDYAIVGSPCPFT